ncbi:flagellar biosynthesis protein FliR [Caulifigura coniformis]|uniref:Flagellar biosynthesis protein FliR n=1 Tax=Caulifigura coniformis TaxID=2527983 RepID=A0A517SHZ5_9PLAN|nr:flagellar biosynthetic protein FliR [Caulifigura coniformis]QDT55743.1 flagellar biosynthesis protein FliR [Caulifigura coniformis]
MRADLAPSMIEVAFTVLGSMAAPLLAAIRILAIVTFASLMSGASIPWRYRIAGSLLLGWAAVGTSVALPGDVGLLAASEVAYGAALGVGVGGLILSLKLAGELIDDRLRLSDAAAEAMISEGEAAGPCVRLLGGIGILLVVLGGTGGAMPVVEGLLESFRNVPVGTTANLWQGWRGPIQVLGGALEIAIRTALPVLAAITILDWCQVLVSRAAPTAPGALAATAVKPLLGLAVLVATFGGACDAVIQGVQWCLAGG